MNRPAVRNSARRLIGTALAILALAGSVMAAENVETGDGVPALVDFPSGELSLKGFLWKPKGNGPFPAILWNHGSERRPGKVEPVASFFVARGYVFFVPHRRGQGRSPGPYIMDQLSSAGSAGERSRMLVELQEVHFHDQLAALDYLKRRPFVNPRRLAVAGASFGGIQTMLAVERAPAYRVAVNCSGAAQSWATAPDLQQRLTAAARKAAMPVFFIQAENDYDLTPNRVLSAQVRASGGRAESKTYPAYGVDARDGHSFCAKGVELWGPDAIRFMAPYLR
jgi:carboxymethylenebutenolidase